MGVIILMILLDHSWCCSDHEEQNKVVQRFFHPRIGLKKMSYPVPRITLNNSCKLKLRERDI